MRLGPGNLPQNDLDLICSYLEPHKASYENAKILIYGGTGFIGTWLTSGLLNANQALNLDLEISLITRNKRLALEKFDNQSNQIQFIQNDLSISEPKKEACADYIFLGATPTSNSTGSNKSIEVVASALNAANHASRARSHKLPKPIVLHLNSGAIYGKQPMEMPLRSESDPTLEFSSEPYIQAKLLIDEILLKAHVEGNVDFKSPRLFAFAGPLIPLREHFAIGNFLQNALSDQKVELMGSQLTIRSYLYPTDLIGILLQLTQVSTKLPLNIGSDAPIKLLDLATKISYSTTGHGIFLSNPSSEPSNYVPSIKNLRETTWKRELISIDEALEKWLKWLKLTNP
jgi:nucleoside-diphosphate-sugar epimerase